ncbi:unnamed protein product [Dimorphilus gyrociliatus]|uniref:Uncharacterized protein n=1 Tax=Dimorphilus gyrociliatus TaxID=2664684 RepID=A0A7I8VYS9_9ANNE|nr:unnamed protein product [Dimorphilus gyrociliatus]
MESSETDLLSDVSLGPREEPVGGNEEPEPTKNQDIVLDNSSFELLYAIKPYHKPKSVNQIETTIENNPSFGTEANNLKSDLIKRKIETKENNDAFKNEKNLKVFYKHILEQYSKPKFKAINETTDEAKSENEEKCTVSLKLVIILVQTNILLIIITIGYFFTYPFIQYLSEEKINTRAFHVSTIPCFIRENNSLDGCLYKRLRNFGESSEEKNFYTTLPIDLETAERKSIAKSRKNRNLRRKKKNNFISSVNNDEQVPEVNS